MDSQTLSMFFGGLLPKVIHEENMTINSQLFCVDALESLQEIWH